MCFLDVGLYAGLS